MKHCDHLHWKLLLSAVKGFVVLRSKARQRSDSGSVLYRRTMFSHRKVQTMSVFIISLITRMRYKRDIKMGRLCTPGGAVIGTVGGGVTFRFF